MRHLTPVLVVLLHAFGVRRESADAARYLAQIHDALQPSVTTEVNVWVNEAGATIRVETSHLVEAPTPAPQGNPAQILSPALPISDVDADASLTLAPPPSPPPPHTEPQNNTTGQITWEHKKTWLHPQEHHHPPAQHHHSRHHRHPRPPQPPPPPPPPPPPHLPDSEFGIAYSPYRADQSCKTQEQVNEDIDRLSHFSLIRIYGTDCDQSKNVITAARRHNMRVFAGVYDLTDYAANLEIISSAVTAPDGKKDWSIIHTVAIGNELVNGGTNSPAEVIHAVQSSRSMLRKEGYQGPVVTVEVFSILLRHPELCKASDYCAANCHAFFDATQHAQDAGSYVLEQAHAVSAAAGGKHTMITESGWPHAGSPNGVAIPSPHNQRDAVESLRRAFAHCKQDLILFTAFDDLWKANTRWTFHAEQFWGIEQGK